MASDKKKSMLPVAIILILGLAFMITMSIRDNRSHEAFVQQFDYDKARQTGLPMLVEFGFKACPPCKMMKPVLKGLAKEHSDDFAIAYIDTVINPQAAVQYNVSAAPTLIFFDKEGVEQVRLIGYQPKEKILTVWKKLGVIPN